MSTAYDKHRRDAAERSRKKSQEGREIGELPAVADPARKERTRASLRAFCEAYFPNRFKLAWSADHLRVLGRLETAIRVGGLFALAMPRGSGKTTICEAACIWAILTGLREFVLLIGSSKPAAIEMMASIQSELESNELLAADWPEVCFPVAALERITARCKGQTYQGRPTRISWRKDELVLPSIPGSPASSAILRVAGITGRIRGQKFTRPDGRTVRPSLVVPDDPQTDASAKSVSQCRQREKIMGGAILGLAGPGNKIAGVCPCTVIRPGDLADSLLSREKHPEWQGERFKLLYEFPAATALWDKYAEMRADDLRGGGDGASATQFYESNRVAMDAGAVVAWPDRYEPGEASGIQYAMNLYYSNPEGFASEYQNQPLTEQDQQGQLDADAIAVRLNGLERGKVPKEATRLTAYVDVQGTVLYYLVAAWSDEFTGSVIDYGTCPDQHRRYFTLSDLQHTLAEVAPGAGLEGMIHAGLTKLVSSLVLREWLREDGAALKIERLGIDANWGASTDVVYSWCRSTPHATIVVPGHGHAVTASSRPWHEYQKREGERLGHHWRLSATAGRSVRHLTIDVNFWKTFIAERLLQPMGDRGVLTLFGKAGQDHRMLADHFCSEFRVRTQGRGRELDEWKRRPDGGDNHLWDCMVGAAAVASLQGAALPGTSATQPARKQVSFKEAQEAARKKREEFERRMGR